MTALLIKDLLITQHKLKKQLILFLLTVLIVGFIEQGALLLPFVGLMVIIHVISTLAYDEQCNWNKFVNTLPLSKSAIVGSKYLLGITLMLGSLIITTPLAIFITHFSDFAIITNIYLTLRIVIAFGFSLQAVMLPIYIQFGSILGRNIMLTVYFSALLLVSYSSSYLDDSIFQLIEMKNASYACLFIGVVFLACSYILSSVIYKRKEF